MGQATRNSLLDPSNPVAHQNHARAVDVFVGELQALEALAASATFSRIEELPAIRADFETDLPLHREVQRLATEGRMQDGVVFLNTEQTPRWRSYRAKIRALNERLAAGVESLRERGTRIQPKSGSSRSSSRTSC